MLFRRLGHPEQMYEMDCFHSQNNSCQVVGAQRANACVQLGNLEKPHFRLSGEGPDCKVIESELVSRMFAKALGCKGRSTW